MRLARPLAPLLCALAALPALAQTSLLIRQAHVIDGTGAPARVADVLVQGDRIAAVAPSIAPPPGAAIVEARGKTLLPGLFDLHTHLLASGVGYAEADWGKVLKAYLYCGVTSVVDLSTYSEQFAPMRRLAGEGLPAPRLHLASRFSSPGGHGLEGGRGDFHTQAVLTPRQARAAVQRILPAKPDLLKVFTDGWRYGVAPDMTSMEEATLAAIVEEAHKAGVKVVTHTVTVDKAKVAARAGVDIIVHGLGDARADDELLSLMKAKGTGYVQTLSVYEPGRAVPPSDPILSRVLEPAFLQRLRPTAAPPAPARLRRWVNLMDNGKRAHQAGVLLGSGTDAGMSGTYHGWASLHEIELMVKTGLTPPQAIAAATGNSARLLGVDAQRGTIAEGKLADLVLAGGLLHEDISLLHRIERVWLGGKETDRPALAASISSPEPTPLTPRPAPQQIDTFDDGDLRSRSGALWINNTDGGHDHAEMLYALPTRRSTGRVLSVMAHIPEKQNPYASMVLPLVPGGIEPADLRGWTGIEFDIRGEGAHSLRVRTRAVRDTPRLAAPIAASASWKRARIPFRSLSRGPNQPFSWRGDDATSLEFVVTGAPGQRVWFELDNVRLYR